MTIRSLFAVCLLVGLVSFAGCKEDKKLKVTGIEPSSGDFQGGTKVTIKGNRFIKDGNRAASVYFGGKKADVLGFSGDAQLIVKTPGGNPGEKVDVLIIFEPGGEITLKQAFTYVEPKEAGVEDLDTSKTK
jgi:hypothetical protein